MEDISWVQKKDCGKDQGDRGKSGTKPKTKTGYEKVGEARLFLPLSRWTEQFWSRLTGMAASEARVYKAHLKTYPIKELNLLEVQAKNPREDVNFTMDPGGAKYLLTVRGFKVHGKELYAQLDVDNAFQIHTGVYLFHNEIRMEYNTVAVGEFDLKIRHPEALINYLSGLASRKFSMTFKLTELVLEEMGTFKKLWLSQNTGMWIDSQSIPLIKCLQLKSEAEAGEIIKTAAQMGNLEEAIMGEKEKAIKSSELDEGKTVAEVLEEQEKERDESLGHLSKVGEAPLTSTRIQDNGEDTAVDEIDRKKTLLETLHKRRTPFCIPIDNEIRDMFERIHAVGVKFGDQDKSDPKVLANLLVTVEALSEVLKEKSERASAQLAEGGENGNRIQARSVEELALGLIRVLEGRDVRDERARRRTAAIKEDWLKSGLQEDFGLLWGTRLESTTREEAPGEEAAATGASSSAPAHWGGAENW